MFSCAQVRPLAGPLKDIHRVVPKLLLHGLGCVLRVLVCETLFRQVCAFPNHVQSREFTTGGLQSRCINMSKDAREKWEATAKEKKSKILFWLCHYGALSVD